MNIKLILLGLFIMFGSVIGALWVSNFWIPGHMAIDLSCSLWAVFGGVGGLLVTVHNCGFKIV